jgi:putative MATE family efflux protein
MFILIGLTNGFAVVTGQRFGAQDETGVRRSFTTSLVLSFGFSAIFTVLLVFMLKPILSAMNVPQEIFNDAYDYLSIIVYGLWTTNLYNVLSSVIRALGDSKTPLYVLITASVLNVVLAILFIAEFNMGVKGAAIAVIVSQAVSAFLCIYFIKKNFPILHIKKADWKFNRKFASYHLKIGVPMALQFSILGLGMLIIQSVCNAFGPLIIGAFTYALRIEQIAIMPMASFGIAMAAYTAQNFGAGNYSRIRQGVRKCSLISLGVSIFMTLVLYIWGADIIRFFAGNTHPDVISIAKSYLNISTLFYFFIGQLFIFRHVLQGMGDAIIPLIASIAELLLRSFAAVYLAVKFSYFGIFFAGPIAWIGAALIVSLGYFSAMKNAVKTARRKKHEKFRVLQA